MSRRTDPAPLIPAANRVALRALVRFRSKKRRDGMRFTRAVAKTWFARQYPQIPVVGNDGKGTFFCKAARALVAVRHGRCLFVNIDHPDYVAWAAARAAAAAGPAACAS